MRATGVVRKIDELGRIVVPIEIRRVYGWMHGTPLEIFTDEKGLVIRGYVPDEEKADLIDQLNDVLLSTKNEEVFKIISNAIAFVEKR